MSDFLLKDISIEGIACAVPKNKVKTIDYYDKFGNKVVDDFIAMTGVKETRRTLKEQTASDLCFAAAQDLISKKNLDRAAIGAIVFISQTPDYILPATSCVLHHRLGLSRNCMAFDVNLGCSGFVYGLNIVGSLFQTSNIENALLLFGDTSIKTAAPEDRASVMLFGEAGSATLLTRRDNKRIMGNLMSDGNGFKAIIVPAGYRNLKRSNERVLCADGVYRNDFEGYMNGADVFSFTISQVPKTVNSFLANHQLTSDIYDGVILHQANLYILKQIARKIKVPMEKIAISLDRFGNTSGTSIPLTICDAYAKKEEGKIHLLMSGFGIGLSWGVADAEIEVKNVFPIIETDDYFRNGGVEFG